MKKIAVILLMSTTFILGGCNSSKTNVRVTSTVATVTRPEETESEPTSEANKEIIEQREGCTFRNSIWGDDVDTVKKYETKINLEPTEDGGLFGKTTVSGYDAYTFYCFENEKLYEGLYLFNLNYTSGGQFITAYNSLKNSLIQKYGTPSIDTIIPNEKESLIEHAGPSKALEYGYVVYTATWEKDNTSIMLTMSSQDYEVGIVIQYRDINYKPDVNNSGL
jgi:hypothetical protein